MTTITLSKAINEGKITELTLREPTWRELKANGLPFNQDGIDFDKALPLVADVTGVMPAYLEAMAASDVIKVVTELGQMMGGEAAAGN